MNFIRIGRAALLALATLFAGAVVAQEYGHHVYIDLDNSAATGCAVATPAGSVTGVEARVSATIATYPAAIQNLTLARCEGGTFGSASVINGSYAVGYDVGAGGSDVIELAVDRVALIGSVANDWTLWFVSTSAATGATDLAGPVLVTGLGTIAAPVPTQPLIIPALSPFGLLLLSIALGLAVVWAARRYRGLLPVLVIAATFSLAGIAYAANYLLDGSVGDWDVAPAMTDPSGDASSDEAPVDIQRVFAAREGGRIFFRIDVLQAQLEQLIPLFVNDSFNVDENSPNGTVVGDMRASPTGLPSLLQFTLLTQAPSAGFAVASNGVITVSNTAALDFETAPVFDLDVNASLFGIPFLSAVIDVTINLNDLGEAPVIDDQALAVLEAAANGTVVGTPVAADPDAGQTLTWAITAGNTLGAFAIDAGTGQITVADMADITLANSPFLLTVQVTDDDVPPLSDTAQITISVTDINLEPSFTIAADPPAILEDAGAQNIPGFASAIDDGDGGTQTPYTFQVTANTNPALFGAGPAIDGTGTLTYTPAADANGTATITVQMQDSGGTAGGGDDTSQPATFTVTVTAVNDAPSFTAGPDENVLQDAGPQSVSPWATALSTGPADEAAQTLGFTITANTNPALFSAGPAIAPDGSLTYTPATGVVGTADVTLTLMDTGGTANGGVDTSAPQTFTINVNNVNDAPVFTLGAAPPASLEDAGAQTVAAFATGIDDGDPPVTQNLTFNITGNTNAALFAVAPAIDATTGNLTYTAAPNANGSADVTVVLMDDGGTAFGGVDTSAPQTFTIAVTAVNDVPAFTAGPTQDVLQDAGPQTVSPWATGISAGPADEAGQTLGFNVTGNTNPALFSAGPAVAADGSLTYTPAAGQVGSADITLTLMDNGGTANGGVDTSAPQTFTINVNNVNDAPVFIVPASAPTSFEDGGAQSVPAFATGIDDGDPPVVQNLTFNVTGNTNPGLFVVAPAIDATTGNLTYTAASDANGSASITVVLMDDGGTAFGGVDTSPPQSFTINVTAVNDVPAFTAGPNQSVLENAGAQTVNPWATGLSTGPADEAAQTLSFNITGNTNPALFSAGPSVAANGALTYTPATDTVGTATITLNVMDNGGTANGGVDTSATQNFTITVNNVNDAPTFNIAAPPPASLEDGGAQNVVAFATAIDDGDTSVVQNLTFNVTGNTNPGLFTVAPAIDATTGNLTYTAAPNANGSASITVVLMDDGGTAFGGTDTSPPQNFTINVTAVNDAPSFTVGPNPDLLENAGPQVISPWATALSAGPADEAAQTLSFNITGNTNPALFSAGPAVSSTGVLTFTSAADASGVATITLNIMDNGGTANGGVDTSATQMFTITVNNVNSAPVFTAGANQTVNEDAGPQTVNPWATGIDDGDPTVAQNLTFNITGNTNAGLFSAGPAVSPTGVLTYTPAANLSGSATITLELMDDGGTAFGGVDTSAPQMFTITVNAVNDAPSFTAGANQTVLEDSGPQTVNPWATAISAGPTDETGQSLTFNIVGNTSPSLFSAGPAISPTGVLTYTPAPNASGVASITIALMDDGGTANGGVDTSPTQNFTITITGVNDAPVFTAGANQTVLEDAGPQTVNPWATGVDDGDPGVTQNLTFQITANDNPALFSTGPSISPTGVLTYTSAANQFGVANLTVQLMDDGGTANGGIDTSTPQNFSITVQPVNDPPTATVKSHTTHSAIELEIVAAAHTGELLEGAADVDDPIGDLIAQIVPGSALPAGAAVTLTNAADGSFRYDPPGGYSGAGSFQFQICDDGVPTAPVACSTPTTVSFNITGPELWFVDDSATPGGDGGLNDPFDSLADLPGARGTGDRIYLHSGTYGSGHTLNADEHLIGQGHSGSSTAHLGVVAVGNGVLDTTPPAGAAPSIGGTVVFGGNNGLLRGVAISSGGSTGVSAGAVTNITALESSITSAATAVNFNGTDAGPTGVVFTSTTSTAGASGIVLNNVTDTFNFGTGALSGHTGVSFLGTGSLGTTSYAGSISKTSAGNIVELSGGAAGTVALSGNLTCNAGCAGIDVLNRGPGTITFSGASKVLNTGANAAVHLDNNDAAQIHFIGGGLDIDTTSGTGFNAVNGATQVTVQGGGNTIDATSGVGLNIVGTTIGAADATLQRISSGAGANVGIALDNTGAAGNLLVTGTGTPGSGGVIANKTGADGSTTSGIGVFLNNTTGVELNWMQLNDFQNSGIVGRSVNGFTLSNSVISGVSGTSTGPVEGPLNFGLSNPSGANGLQGTGVIRNSRISGGIEHNVEFYNQSGSMNLTIEGLTAVSEGGNPNSPADDVADCIIEENSLAGGADGIQIEMQNSSTATILIRRCLFRDNRSQPVQVSALNDSDVILTIEESRVRRFDQGNEGYVLQNGSNGDLSMRVSGNHVNGLGGVGIYGGQVAGNASTSAELDLAFINNTVNQGTAATNHGILSFQTSTVGQLAPARLDISGNTVVNDSLTGTTRGVLVDTPDTSTSPDFDATVSNNSVAVGDNVNGVSGVVVQSRQSAVACTDIVTNTVTFPNGTPAGIAGLRARQVAPATMTLEQGPGCTGTAAAVLGCRNPASTTEVLGTISVVANGTCQAPAVP